MNKKFYVIEIATGDSKIAGKGIYEYDSLDLAIASFHSKMGTAMKSELYATELVMVINDDGGVHRSEKYVRPVVEEEPVIEPVEESTEA